LNWLILQGVKNSSVDWVIGQSIAHSSTQD